MTIITYGTEEVLPSLVLSQFLCPNYIVFGIKIKERMWMTCLDGITTR
jgi:hypothetical protein